MARSLKLRLFFADGHFPLINDLQVFKLLSFDNLL